MLKNIYIVVLFWKTFQTRKNFPGSNATLLPRFFSLCYMNYCHLTQPTPHSHLSLRSIWRTFTRRSQGRRPTGRRLTGWIHTGRRHTGRRHTGSLHKRISTEGTDLEIPLETGTDRETSTGRGAWGLKPPYTPGDFT